jgi:ribosomal protection tetracycline resistance protein
VFFINKIDRAGCEPETVLDELRRLCSPFIVPVGSFGEDERECLCDADDALAERYLSGEAISESLFADTLKRLSREAKAFPCVFGSAINGLGVDALLDAIQTYIPALESEPEGEPSGVIYKVEHDPRMGKLAHVRMFGGTLRNRDSVKINGEVSESKIIQIRRVNGALY